MTNLIPLLPEMVLAGAALALILIARHVKRARFAAAWVVIATAAAIACSWAFSVNLTGPRTGFGGTIAGDGYAQFFNVLFAANLVLVTLLSERHLDSEHVPAAEYYALLLLASTGMMLAASAADLLILYLGLELMTLCSYILVGITRDRPASNEAAIKYFLLGSFASALFLYGIGFVYGVTGATDFATIASVVSERSLGQHPLLLVGVALVAGGLAFKIAAVPFHAWAPDAYQGATAPVAAFLAAGSKAAGLAAFVRVCMVAFALEQHIWSEILVGLAALSLVVGSLVAVSQSNMKRLLAYSSIAHAGYALLGLIPGTPDGASATMTYAFVYSFMTLGAFGVVIALGQRGEDLVGYRGLAATAPGTAALMFLFLLSLTGIPPTAGFAAKFAVILSAVRAGYVVLAVLAVLCSVVSAFFYLRVAVLMYMAEPEGSAPERVPAAVSAALAVAAVVTIIGGIFPNTFAAWTVPP
ncbi:MAG: NADH-quinone oxidoreductase subunit N [Acidobacteria bacterium]|nr:NADH-quinone oxidoreductase subunit N [Acidobacteriota bacterium]MBI3263219.1 NADH-quinone oxidoreductase subunit N [Acidobacteriota bacterium]